MSGHATGSMCVDPRELTGTAAISRRLTLFDPDNSPHVTRGCTSEPLSRRDEMLGRGATEREERVYYVYHPVVVDLHWQHVLKHVPAGSETPTELVELKKVPSATLRKCRRPARLSSVKDLRKKIAAASSHSKYSKALSLLALLSLHYPHRLHADDIFLMGAMYSYRSDEETQRDACVIDAIRVHECFVIRNKLLKNDLRDRSVQHSLILMGNAHLLLGCFDVALVQVSKLVEVRPDIGDHWKTRGFVRDQLGDGEGAVQDYIEAVRIDPKNGSTRCNLAHTLHKLLRFKEALETYEKGLPLVPRGYKSDPTLRARVLLRRGMLYAQTKQHELAVHDWLECFEDCKGFPRLETYLVDYDCIDDVVCSIREAAPPHDGLATLRRRVEDVKAEQSSKESEKERRTGFASIAPFSGVVETGGGRSLKCFASLVLVELSSSCRTKE